MTYYVYLDYGYQTERLLAQTERLDKAIRYAERESGRLDGKFRSVEVATFAADGEYVTHTRLEGDLV